MALVSNIDGENRLIYLSSETVDASINPIDIYKEVRNLRASNEELRKYDNFIAGKGHIPKGGGKFTERYTILLKGTRIVPYNTSHVLTITGTIITDDGKEGVYCFNRSLLDQEVTVDINYVPPQVEVIAVQTGGLNDQQNTLLEEIHSSNTNILNVISRLPLLSEIRQELININYGKLVIDSQTDEMIIYDKNNNIIAKFDLYDNLGNLNAEKVYRREPKEI